MKVKIFTGSGKSGIERVEREINGWMALPGIGVVKDSQTALCQVADSADGERYQCIVVTIWYEPPKHGVL